MDSDEKDGETVVLFSGYILLYYLEISQEIPKNKGIGRDTFSAQIIFDPRKSLSSKQCIICD